MASTYTSSIQFQKIGNGEQAGTWGTSTNTNWDLSDQAIAGATTITMSNANYSLSSLNGATDESRSMFLILSGSNSTTNKITVPYGGGGVGTGSKMYVVYNNTSGGQSVNIGYSGGTTVTIPNGKICTIFGDGTNFYSAATTTTGSFNVNGDLTVSGALSATGIADLGDAAIGGNFVAAGILGAYLGASFTGTLAGTTLTVSAVASGVVFVGQILTGSGIPSGTYITAYGTGSGGIGTYTINKNISPTLTSIGITGSPQAVTSTPSTGDNSLNIATTQFVQNTLSSVYPVGSIYMNASVSTNPATLLGFGTWTALGAGRMLMGVGGGYAAGATGGSADAIVVSHTHTATVTDPGHNHIERYSSNGGTGYMSASAGAGSSNSGNTTTTSTTGISVSNSTTGSSGTGANLPPYLVVYMWQRTA